MDLLHAAPFQNILPRPFCKDNEKPEVKQITFRLPAIKVAVIGEETDDPFAEQRLRQVTEQVRSEIIQLPAVLRGCAEKIQSDTSRCGRRITGSKRADSRRKRKGLDRRSALAS